MPSACQNHSKMAEAAEEETDYTQLPGCFDKIAEFLHSRNLDLLYNLFVVNKINDEIAHCLETTKLMEIGLVYGDIIAFRQTFPSSDSKLSTYKQKADELRKKIQKTHAGRNDALNRPVTIHKTYQVTFGIKCFEKKKYILKLNKSIVKSVDRTANYDDVHEIARTHFDIPAVTKKTYIGNYRGRKLSDSFKDMESYALSLKDKKSSVHLYLYYPKSYSKLLLQQMQSDSACDEDDEAQFTNDDDMLPEMPTKSTVDEQINKSEPICTGRKICLVCSCTFDDHCLRCEQNMAFQESLCMDQQKENISQQQVYEDPIDSSDDSNEATPTMTELREARLNHFSHNRLRQPPLKYRHSIGSPSLLFSNGSLQNVGDEEAFGDDEIERYFGMQQDNSVVILDVENLEDDSINNHVSTESIITEIKASYENKEKQRKPVIAQRDLNRFWSVIFRQKFDLRVHAIKIRFAGESGADAGGPLLEFLTLCMRNFWMSPTVFGSRVSVCFKDSPVNYIDQHYFILGQLTAVSIITIGRGPECLNELVVLRLFEQPLPDEISPSCSAELDHYLQKIDEGDNDILFEHNITPSADKAMTKRLFIISYLLLKPAGAIQQFKEGIASIDPKLIEPGKFSLLKCFFQASDCGFDIQDMLNLFEFYRNAEPGSNASRIIENCICDFELFINEVWNSEVKDSFGSELSLSDVLFLFTGLDRIPPFGLTKKIEVYFDENVQLPKISTCALNVTLPVKDVEPSLKVALSFGHGFGDI